jgi:hypothetical protein
MIVDRRRLLSGTGTILLAGAGASSPVLAAATQPFAPLLGPRARVVYVNDLSGDIDGLFSAVHAILSPSIDLRAIVGTGTGEPGQTAAASAARAHEMLGLMDREGRFKVFEGAPGKLERPGVPVRSAGTQAIIDQAMRTDSRLPLFVAVGGGLTEVASALMIEPRIAERFTLVWIGGQPIPGPGGPGEYNFGIDPLAAMHVFNETTVPIWQVSNAVYATCAVSDTELQAYVAPCGKIGQWLYHKIFEWADMLGQHTLNTGETYTLGDSPLVLLTALTGWVPSAFVAPLPYERTDSSQFDIVAAPRVKLDGSYEARADGRKIRAYRSVDTRLMFSDFFAKLSINFRA